MTAGAAPDVAGSATFSAASAPNAGSAVHEFMCCYMLNYSRVSRAYQQERDNVLRQSIRSLERVLIAQEHKNNSTPKDIADFCQAEGHALGKLYRFHALGAPSQSLKGSLSKPGWPLCLDAAGAAKCASMAQFLTQLYTALGKKQNVNYCEPFCAGLRCHVLTIVTYTTKLLTDEASFEKYSTQIESARRRLAPEAPPVEQIHVRVCIEALRFRLFHAWAQCAQQEGMLSDAGFETAPPNLKKASVLPRKLKKFVRKPNTAAFQQAHGMTLAEVLDCAATIKPTAAPTEMQQWRHNVGALAQAADAYLALPDQSYASALGTTRYGVVESPPSTPTASLRVQKARADAEASDHSEQDVAVLADEHRATADGPSTEAQPAGAANAAPELGDLIDMDGPSNRGVQAPGAGVGVTDSNCDTARDAAARDLLVDLEELLSGGSPTGTEDHQGTPAAQHLSSPHSVLQSTQFSGQPQFAQPQQQQNAAPPAEGGFPHQSNPFARHSAGAAAQLSRSQMTHSATAPDLLTLAPTSPHGPGTSTIGYPPAMHSFQGTMVPPGNPGWPNPYMATHVPPPMQPGFASPRQANADPMSPGTMSIGGMSDGFDHSYGQQTAVPIAHTAGYNPLFVMPGGSTGMPLSRSSMPVNPFGSTTTWRALEPVQEAGQATSPAQPSRGVATGNPFASTEVTMDWAVHGRSVSGTVSDPQNRR